MWEEIVLLSATGIGTVEIMTGQVGPRRSQQRFMEVMEESVAGLLRDKPRPPGRTLLAAAMINQVLTRTATESLTDAVHCTRRRW
ncbi:MAG: transposase [Microvirga sp.]|nr:transposase [Microvirga sp.]